MRLHVGRNSTNIVVSDQAKQDAVVLAGATATVQAAQRPLPPGRGLLINADFIMLHGSAVWLCAAR